MLRVRVTWIGREGRGEGRREGKKKEEGKKSKGGEKKKGKRQIFV